MSDDPSHSSLSVPPSTRDHFQGVLSATVALVMYGDYQCTQSAKAYRLIQTIQRQHGVSSEEQDFCFIFRHFPQVQIHPHAQRAAEAAEAAAVQSQFWQMHDMLFSHQYELGNGYLIEYANHLGLNIFRFLQDLSKGVYVDRINQDIKSGHQSEVVAAPTLFINGIRYSDRYSQRQLTAALINITH